MAVVVTGSAGFIGQHLADSFHADRIEVIGIDRQRPRSQWYGQHILADLLDRNYNVEKALAEASAVFHLAGCPGVRDHKPDIEQRRHRDNVLATAYVLGRVSPTVPIVVTSSSSVYGGSWAGRPCRESDRLNPLGGYACSKAAVEQLCVDRLQAGGLVAIARPFSVAGEGQRPDMAIARWIESVANDRPVKVIGDLSRTRDVCDVRDAVKALRLLVEYGVTGPVNVGTGVGHTLGEILDTVGWVMAKTPRIEFVEASWDEPDHTLADISRLFAETGFRPITDLTKLVARQYRHRIEGCRPTS